MSHFSNVLKRSAHTNKARYAFVVVASFLLLSTLLPFMGVQAQDGSEQPMSFDLGGYDAVDLDRSDLALSPASSNPRLSSSLNMLYDSTVLGIASPSSSLLTPSYEIVGDQVKVMVTANSDAETAAVLNAIGTLGGNVTAQYGRWIDAFLPISALYDMASTVGVNFVSQPSYTFPLGDSGNIEELLDFDSIEENILQNQSDPIVLDPSADTGTNVTQGVAASNAGAWHEAGITGAGVKVAVIDVFQGYTDAQAAGELPPGDRVGTYASVVTEGSPHGTACAEIIYDMAPGVDFTLTTPNTAVEMANAIRYFTDNGYQVISSSFGFYNSESGEGAGPVSDAANYANSNGTFYAQAAGNQAEYNYQILFNDTDGDGLHEFASGDELQALVNPTRSDNLLPSGFPLNLYLRWGDWPTTSQDYELLLFGRTDPSGSWELAWNSSNPQASTPPVEQFNGSTSAVAEWAIAILSNGASGTHIIDLMGHNAPPFEHNMRDRSLVDPATSAGVFGVAAIDATSFDQEPYSSQGPTLGAGGVLDGGRNQPRIAGYANVDTLSYGPGGFNGTSSATPHVAGAAALVIEAFTKADTLPTTAAEFTPDDVKTFLEGRAIDLGDSGYDLSYGAGRLNLGDPLEGGTDPGPTEEPPTEEPPDASDSVLDLVFVIDTTGSMGDDIDEVKEAATDLVNNIATSGRDYRIGIILYRDHSPKSVSDEEATAIRTAVANGVSCDDVPTVFGSGDFPACILLNFSNNQTTIVNAIDSITVGGGGDFPETVFSGLVTTIGLDWRADALKTMIVMGDAPPQDPETVTGYTLTSVLNAAIAADVSVAIPLEATLTATDSDAMTFDLRVNTNDLYAGTTQFDDVSSIASDGVCAAGATTTPTEGSIRIFPILVGSDSTTTACFAKIAEDTNGEVFEAESADEVVAAVTGAIDLVTIDPLERAYPRPDTTVRDYITNVRWGQDPDKEWYQFLMYNPATGEVVGGDWFAATDAIGSEFGYSGVCDGLICSAEAPIITNGTWEWYLRTYDAETETISDYVSASFTVDAPTTSPPRVNNVFSTVNSLNEGMEFNPVDGAGWYGFYIYNNTTGEQVLGSNDQPEWYPAADSDAFGISGVCAADVCSVPFPADRMPNGEYTIFTIAYGPAGVSSFSSGREFTLLLGTPGEPTRTNPTDGGSIAAGSVNMTWEQDPNTAWYNVNIGGPSSSEDWYYYAEICSGGTCTLPRTLSAGSYTWEIQGWNAENGLGPVSSSVFTVTSGS